MYSIYMKFSCHVTKIENTSDLKRSFYEIPLSKKRG